MTTIAIDTKNNKDAYAALMSGHHGDPFSILGVHQAGGSRIIRTLQPHAERVEIVDNDGAVLGEMASTPPHAPDSVGRQTDWSDLMEGLYIKVEEDGRVTDSFKLVRPDFLTTVTDSESHWQSRPILPYRLAASGTKWE